MVRFLRWLILRAVSSWWQQKSQELAEEANHIDREVSVKTSITPIKKASKNILLDYLPNIKVKPFM